MARLVLLAVVIVALCAVPYFVARRTRPDHPADPPGPSHRD